MRKAVAAVLVLGTLVLATLVLTTSATPATARLSEVERLAELRAELDDLLTRYEALEREAGRAWLRAASAERSVHDAGEVVEQAEARLHDRIRTIYQLGPGSTLEALLGARSFAELGTIGVYSERALALDGATLRDSIVAEAVLIARRSEAEAAREDLDPRLLELRDLLVDMERAVAEALLLADRARIAERERRELEAQQAAVAAAAARQGSWDLGVIDYRQDQSHLLALLGPTGGRTCETPPGLVETGETFSGYASWYGWEFGGQPTATGAIFDPTLFTAANRWLPFGTFLRVRFEGRCALVLINDRGPYGRLERVIDLSMASAHHLGVGVDWVSADILIPASSVAA